MLLLLLAVCGALCTARITRLLTADRLTESFRRQVLSRVQEGGHIEYLVSCRWCLSVWIAIPVAVLVVTMAPGLRPDLTTAAAWTTLLTFSFSQVAGQLASREVEV